METRPVSASVRAPLTVHRLLSDARLVELAAHGSEEAFATIFRRHHQALYRYCRSMLSNDHDAADALQNTFVRVLRALPGETREIALRPWLYRVAHNEVISLLRRRRPESELDAALELSDESATARSEGRERLLELAGDLRELSERQRAALLMRELADLSFEEIGAALGGGPRAAKQHLYEARSALHELAAGRRSSCEEIRRTLSERDGRRARGRRVRGHLKACPGCEAFLTALRRRPAQLAALAPPLPAAAGVSLLGDLLKTGAPSGADLAAAGAGAAGASGGPGVVMGVKATAVLTAGVKAVATGAAAVSIAAGGVWAGSGPGEARVGGQDAGATSRSHRSVAPRPTGAADPAGTAQATARPGIADRDSARRATADEAAAQSKQARREDPTATPMAPAPMARENLGADRGDDPRAVPETRPSHEGTGRAPNGKPAPAAPRRSSPPDREPGPPGGPVEAPRPGPSPEPSPPMSPPAPVAPAPRDPTPAPQPAIPAPPPPVAPPTAAKQPPAAGEAAEQGRTGSR